MKTIRFVLSLLVAIICVPSVVLAGVADYPVIGPDLKTKISQTSAAQPTKLIGSEGILLHAGDFVAITLPQAVDNGNLFQVSFNPITSAQLPGYHTGDWSGMAEPILTLVGGSVTIKPTADIVYWRNSNNTKEYGGYTIYLGQKIFFYGSSTFVNSTPVWTTQVTWGTGSDYLEAGSTIDRTQFGTLPTEPRAAGCTMNNFFQQNGKMVLVIEQDSDASLVLEESSDLTHWTTCPCSSQTVINSAVYKNGVKFEQKVITPTATMQSQGTKHYFRLRRA